MHCKPPRFIYLLFHRLMWPYRRPALPHMPAATWNAPRSPSDLYTPRFVRGRGRDKVGLCSICCEHVDRGGESKRVWLAMKVSAFKW